MSEQRLEASSRVALAAYLHDLGKFAERARLDVSKDDLDYHKQEYCPRRPTENGGYFNTHIHAAYTALAFNLIEQLVCSAARRVHGNADSDFIHSVCHWRHSRRKATAKLPWS